MTDRAVHGGLSQLKDTPLSLVEQRPFRTLDLYTSHSDFSSTCLYKRLC